MIAQPHGRGGPLSPAEIRASLQTDASPRNIRARLPHEDQVTFEAQYREALRRAGDELDLTPLHECVESWRRLAILKADPADYAQIMETAERIQLASERGEPTGGVPWDDAYTACLRDRHSAAG